VTGLPLHVDIPGYAVENNTLLVGGRPITDIVGDADPPCYVYDSALIRRRIEELRRDLPERLELHYAIKANPMEEVVQLIAPLVDGLDVASGRELEIALRTQTPVTEISFAGPGKRDAELEQAVRAGITVNVESPGELRRLQLAADAAGRRARVAIRVNPNFELKGSGMRMSGGPKPFGIDAEVVPAVIAGLEPGLAELVGLHIFAGSQNLNAEALMEAQSLTVQLAIDLARAIDQPLTFVNIGGGFGIPYFKGDRRLDVPRVGVHLERLLDTARDALPQTRFVTELGRYIVGEAGVYACRVIDRKVSRGQTFLVTNGGMHHHLAASGNFGQVIRKDYPCLIGTRVGGPDLEEVAIVGPLCTPLDIIAAKLTVPVGTDVGDIVVVFQSGAYGLTSSPAAFLSHPAACELVV
jgi:diaminopimelate decarboxylase